MLVHRIAAMTTFVTVAGCMPAVEPVQPTPTVIRSYEIGAVHSAGIGDPIFDVQAAVKVPIFRAIRAHDPGRQFLTQFPKISMGQRFVATGTLEDGTFVVRPLAGEEGYPLVVVPDGRVLGYWDGRNVAGGDWPAEPLMVQTETLAGQEDAFRAQLIYSGLDGRTMRADYREFAGDFIRPAFSQELQYDLSQDSTIAYKTIEIEIIEATNSRVRYRVLDDGGLEWLPVAVP